MKVNGAKIDGVAGTRTWSQYDKRTIYGVYDLLDHVTSGDNAIGVYAGGGWYGMWGYGQYSTSMSTRKHNLSPRLRHQA